MDVDWIVGWFFTFFGLLGNSWIIFIVAKRRRLQTTTNWFILSLAVADLGVTCGHFPASMICNVLVNTCNNDVRIITAFFFLEASALCLTAMIGERYIAIVYSLKYVRLMTTKNTIIIIATCWAIPFLLIVYELIIYLTSIDYYATGTPIFVAIYTALLLVLPTILCFGAHLQILVITHKRSREMRVLFKQVRFNVEANSVKIMGFRNVGIKTSTVRLVTALVIIFIACYGLEIRASICTYFNLCNVSDHELAATNLLLLANSTLNPLVYAFLKEDIKREKKALLCRRREPKLRPFQVHP